MKTKLKVAAVTIAAPTLLLGPVLFPIPEGSP